MLSTIEIGGNFEVRSRSRMNLIGSLFVPALIAFLFLWGWSTMGEVMAYTLATFVGIFAIVALSLNFEAGVSGLVNFGKVAFFAVGAYVTALLASMGHPVWIAVPVAMFASAIAGYCISLPALRLRGDFLAIVTLAVAEIFNQFLRSEVWLAWPSPDPNDPLTWRQGGYRGLLIDNPVEALVSNPLISQLFSETLIMVAIITIPITFYAAAATIYFALHRQQNIRTAYRMIISFGGGLLASMCLIVTEVLFLSPIGLSILNQRIYFPGIAGNAPLGVIMLCIGLAAIVAAISFQFFANLLMNWKLIRRNFSDRTYITYLLAIIGTIVAFIVSFLLFGSISAQAAGFLITEPEFTVPFWTMVFSLILLIASYIFFELLYNSPFGRILKALRDDETATLALGKNTFQLKAKAFMIGSALAGLGGAIYAYSFTFISPDSFMITVTFDIWVMMIIGGMANNRGIILGAMIIQGIEYMSRFLKDEIEAAASDFGSFLTSTIPGFIVMFMISVLIVTAILWIVFRRYWDEFRHDLRRYVHGKANLLTIGLIIIAAIPFAAFGFPLMQAVILSILSIEPAYARQMLVGVLLILFIMFRPRGVIPERPVETPALGVSIEPLVSSSKTGVEAYAK